MHYFISKNSFSSFIVIALYKGPSGFFGIRDFPYLKRGIQDFKAKSGRDSGLKVRAGDGMPKTTLGITGLLEMLGRDYGIKEPHSEPSSILPCTPSLRASSPFGEVREVTREQRAKRDASLAISG